MTNPLSLGWMMIALFFLQSCSHIAQNFPSYPVNQENIDDLLKATTDAYHLAEKVKARGDQMLVAKKGMRYADLCLQKNKSLPDCHYYKALNTGLYYEARVVGYHKGLKIIVEEAQKVIDLDPSYDYGGGYRVLGRLYAKIPAFAVGKTAVRRDLDKSIDYLQKAITIAPHYPENYLFLADSLYESNRLKEALKILHQMWSHPLQPEWRPMMSQWRREGDRLLKAIHKSIPLPIIVY
ncbi:MAG: hypothetical protein A3I75_01030 [Deltaproteobacteria bacterium RIFCSPLOWO2_02_FULL_50_16]|nr:MAG: hypothetical protein A2053_00140 [Deltaproteobacteria bacterium GWA2_50_8]OGQ32558.1 MAG: hypothetical protein A3B79_01345 [Deltaproteobacteria bacterium RIFCSPHIGHO2_02_FULL_50_15]OGQ55881.1 MAG: hypothetical protein A3I75_01030 [Deltaproteobacteria bacterium RIFCSPLOWO2_02_FULL_50_16]OGQ66949.1 MAG: hypothetical protein A3F89_08200 [Deltaproteobacteria bacterium RIFCSPLOWO2_12_FULL_50_11]